MPPNLTTPAEPAGLVAAVERSFGRLDILVCNAGSARRGNFLTLTDQDWNDGFALNFLACPLVPPGLAAVEASRARSSSSPASVHALRSPIT